MCGARGVRGSEGARGSESKLLLGFRVPPPVSTKS